MDWTRIEIFSWILIHKKRTWIRNTGWKANLKKFYSKIGNNAIGTYHECCGSSHYFADPDPIFDLISFRNLLDNGQNSIFSRYVTGVSAGVLCSSRLDVAFKRRSNKFINYQFLVLVDDPVFYLISLVLVFLLNFIFVVRFWFFKISANFFLVFSSFFSLSFG
jgi:hypothetical protein